MKKTMLAIALLFASPALAVTTAEMEKKMEAIITLQEKSLAACLKCSQGDQDACEESHDAAVQVTALASANPEEVSAWTEDESQPVGETDTLTARINELSEDMSDCADAVNEWVASNEVP